MNDRKTRLISGFTLIEMLVVVSIFVALLALGVYWLNNAVYSSKLMTSQRNLAAIGQMLAEYASDHRGTYPRPADSGLASADNKYGATAFTSRTPSTEPYLGDKIFPKYCSEPTLFYCPLSNYVFVATLWFKKSDNTFNIPPGVSWSYTYLRHRGPYHIDADVTSDKVLAQTCSLYGKYRVTGPETFDRDTIVLYFDMSIKRESKFKW